MRKFQNTDYVRNKYSKGILYKVSDGYIEVTLEDYLRENPEEDFMELKKISDEIYYEQGKEEAGYAKRKDELSEVENIVQLVEPMVETTFIKKMEKEEIKRAAEHLLTKGNLTLVQKRRFYLHFYKGLSYREIGKLEGVHFTSVQESIESCIKKLKKNISILD